MIGERAGTVPWQWRVHMALTVFLLALVMFLFWGVCGYGMYRSRMYAQPEGRVAEVMVLLSMLFLLAIMLCYLLGVRFPSGGSMGGRHLPPH
jgi:hypothetical protein